MEAFKENNPAVIIGNLVLELEGEKKKVKQLERDKKCLENILQTKQAFEVRVWIV